jgi:hypothetical protein
MFRVLVSIIVLACTLWPASGFTAPLAPAKASDVLTLTTSLPPNLCADGDRTAIDRVANSDGTFSPFVIPPKTVLVVTGMVWGANGAQGTQFNVSLARVNGFAINPVFEDSAVVGSGSVAVSHAVVPEAVVKSGTQLCVAFFGDGSPASSNFFVQGLLAADK